MQALLNRPSNAARGVLLGALPLLLLLASCGPAKRAAESSGGQAAAAAEGDAAGQTSSTKTSAGEARPGEQGGGAATQVTNSQTPPEPPPAPTPPPEPTLNDLEALRLPALAPAAAAPAPLDRLGGSAPTLHQVSVNANKVTDDDAWWAALDMSPPRQMVRGGERVPAAVGSGAGGLPLRVTWTDGDWTFAQFGPNWGDLPLLGVVQGDQPVALFDFTAWQTPPAIKSGDEMFVGMSPSWATVVDEALVVCHGHRTYAESSGGDNAFLTAINLRSGALRWRSETLTCGGHFLVLGDHIVTGYGFTAEPDWLHVVSLADGSRGASIKLKSAPNWFVIDRQGRLQVRTYNTDYVFEIER